VGKSILVYTSHRGQLSLAIPLWVGTMSTSRRAVMLCGWGVEAGMVCVWVASKTMWSPCYHGPYLSSSEIRFILREHTNRHYLALLYIFLLHLWVLFRWLDRCSHCILLCGSSSILLLAN